MVAAPSLDTNALRAVPQHIVGARGDHDADRFARATTENATLNLPGDVFLAGREEIRFLTRNAVPGPFKGTRATGNPGSVRPPAGEGAAWRTASYRNTPTADA